MIIHFLKREKNFVVFVQIHNIVHKDMGGRYVFQCDEFALCFSFFGILACYVILSHILDM